MIRLNSITNINPVVKFLCPICSVVVIFSAVYGYIILGGVAILCAGLISSYNSYVHYKTFNKLETSSIVYAIACVLTGLLVLCL